MSRPKHDAAIDRDLNEVIDMLVAGGREVSFTSVAKAAGRSRSLVSSSDTYYSAARDRILAIKEEARRPARIKKPRVYIPRDEEVEELRRQVLHLDALCGTLRSTLAAHVAATRGAATGSVGQQIADIERRRAARAARAAVEGVS